MNQIMALWTKESKKKEKYLSGTFLGIRVNIFPNKGEKKGENAPDYFLCVSLPKPSTEGNSESQPDDDLPF